MCLVSTRGIVVNVLYCNILVNEFELQLRYYVLFQINTFGKGMNPLIPQISVK